MSHDLPLGAVLKQSSTIPYGNAMTTEENAAKFIKKRRIRKLSRGEPRKSARGHITRFAPRGRWLKVEGRPNKSGRENAELWALHATKGWRRVPSGVQELLMQQAAIQHARQAEQAAKEQTRNLDTELSKAPI